jgi:hypothetical protein
MTDTRSPEWRAAARRAVVAMLTVAVLAVTPVIGRGATAVASTPPAPFHVVQTFKPFHGLYLPIKGDFAGDGKTEILWYKPGGAPESLWRATATTFTVAPGPSVNGQYEPLTGDFNGDGKTDIFWYAPGAASDALWFGSAGPSLFTHGWPVSVTGSFTPVVGDFNGDGLDDIVWPAAGAARDYVWLGGATGFAHSWSINVVGRYYPVKADFNGDGLDDVLWIGRGVYKMWLGGPSGFVAGWAITAPTQSGPLPGNYDFNGDGKSDLIWLVAGSSSFNAEVQYSNGSGFDAPQPVGSGPGFPALADFSGDGRTDVLWWSVFTSEAAIITATPTGFSVAVPITIATPSSSAALREALIMFGDFNGDGKVDIVVEYVGETVRYLQSHVT